MESMDHCPWCKAPAADTFTFACGSIRPNYVTPSSCQADSCRIAMLHKTIDRMKGYADDLLRAYNQRDDVRFEALLLEMKRT